MVATEDLFTIKGKERKFYDLGTSSNEDVLRGKSSL